MTTKTYKEENYTEYTGKLTRTQKRYFLQHWGEQWGDMETSIDAKIKYSHITGRNSFECDSLNHQTPGLYTIHSFICEDCRRDLDKECIQELENEKQEFIPIDPYFNYTIYCKGCNRMADYIGGELDGTKIGMGINDIHENEGIL
jgi:uncharacterized protein YlaI